ncbi:MAG: tRNA adenosine(34) deaminase TadA [Myxococcota bacterium]
MTCGSSDELFMGLALVEAERALVVGDVPVGAVVVYEGRVVGRGHNRREADADPLAHAEVCALRQAASALGRWRLSSTTLYVTLEPCFMCAGALVNARVDRLVYGATDKKAGAVASLAAVCTDMRLNHRLEVVSGVREAECAEQLRRFFQALRARRRAPRGEP